MENNIQTIIDKYNKRFSNANFTWTSIEDAIKSRNRFRRFLKDSLTSMLDELTDKLPYYSSDGDTEWANGYNQYRDEVINIINSHR